MRWIVLCSLLISCAAAVPQLPEELVSHNEETQVEASEHRLDFAPFYADHIRREKQKLRFHTQMKGKSFVIQAACEGRNTHKVSCTLENETTHYKLQINLNRRGEASGHLSGDDVRLEIKTLFEDKDGTMHQEPLAFAIMKDGKAIAVLDATAAGKYWYKVKAPTQELGLAAAIASLLQIWKTQISPADA